MAEINKKTLRLTTLAVLGRFGDRAFRFGKSDFPLCL